MNAAKDMSLAERTVCPDKYDDYSDQATQGFIILAIGAGIFVASAVVDNSARSSSKKSP